MEIFYYTHCMYDCTHHPELFQAYMKIKSHKSLGGAKQYKNIKKYHFQTLFLYVLWMVLLLLLLLTLTKELGIEELLEFKTEITYLFTFLVENDWSMNVIIVITVMEL